MSKNRHFFTAEVLVCLGLILCVSPLNAQDLQTVKVDLSAREFLNKLPYDVPFFIKGKITSQVNYVRVSYNYGKETASKLHHSTQWVRKNKDDKEFLVKVEQPTIEPYKAYRFQFIFTPRFLLAVSDAPKVVGADFEVELLALDDFGQVDKSFKGNLELSLTNGKMTPSESCNFREGALKENFKISNTDKRCKDFVLAARIVPAKAGDETVYTQPRLITVKQSSNAPVAGYSISAPDGGDIGTQVKGEGFGIRIEALDSAKRVSAQRPAHDLKLSFDGAVVDSVSKDKFRQGVWTGEITIMEEALNQALRIKENTPRSPKFGKSNMFNVLANENAKLIKEIEDGPPSNGRWKERHYAYGPAPKSSKSEAYIYPLEVVSTVRPPPRTTWMSILAPAFQTYGTQKGSPFLPMLTSTSSR